MRKRTLARDWALKILYQMDITKRPIESLAEQFLEEQEDKDPEVVEFCNRLVLGVAKNLETIDEKISAYATNWQLKRMAVIDRNVLRLGMFELHYTPDIPPKVSINEAVDLAKMYGDMDSGKFVNGILDKVHKTEILTQDKAE